MDRLNKNKQDNFKLGFTIVELLIVIVIIGILAAITIVSYIGLTAKASEATLKSDLASSYKLLSLYYNQYGEYPHIDADTGCPTAPTVDSNYCLKFSSGVSFEYTYKTATTYGLTANKDDLVYAVTESQPPTKIVVVHITAIAAISGTAQVSQTLTAGNVTPAEATVSYQWQYSATSGGTYSDILNATSSTYDVSPSYNNKYLRVVVTGTGTTTGTQSSAYIQIAANANWLTIGSQTWAKTNLNTGTMINLTATQTNNSVVEKYCYANDESMCASYGALYQWNEAMGYSTVEGSRGICPIGTHIPSDNDWKILEMQLGMTQAVANTTGSRGTTQGTQLKNGGTSGLNVPLGGYRNTSGAGVSYGSLGYLWASSIFDSTYRWVRVLNSSQANVNRNGANVVWGASIRCLGN